MDPLRTAQPITQRLVQVHAIVEKITGVKGPLRIEKCSNIQTRGQANLNGKKSYAHSGGIYQL